MPVGAPRASRRTSNTENGRRSSGSRPAPALTITNCPGRGGGGDRRRVEPRARCSRSTAGDSRSLPPTRRSASRQYTARNRGPSCALPAHVEQLAGRRSSGERVHPRARPAAESLAAARCPRGCCRWPRPSASSTRCTSPSFSTSLLVVRQLVAREPFSPAWVSVGVLVWLGAAASAAGAALMWANLRTFSLVLEPRTARTLVSGAFSLVASAALFLVIALLRRRSSPRGRVAWACARRGDRGRVAGRAGRLPGPRRAGGAGAGVRSTSRPDAGAPDRPARVTVLAIDAGSLDYITSATAEGRLPNFGRVLDAGAVMRMATLIRRRPRPSGRRSPPASCRRRTASGRRPRISCRRAATSSQLLPGLLLRARPRALRLPGGAAAHLSRAARAAALEHPELARHPASASSAWPLTYPAPAVNGYLVSDAYQRLSMTPSGLERRLGHLSARAARQRCRPPRRRPPTDGDARARRAARRRAGRARRRRHARRSRRRSNRAGARRPTIPCRWRSCAIRASIRSGTTSSATRCRPSSATSPTKRCGGTVPCSTATTPSSTPRSGARSRRSGPTTCC